MIIKVPLKYEATVHKKRFKQPSRETFFEWLDVDLAEIDDIDAPVATQWFDEMPKLLDRLTDRLNWGATPQDGVCQTRWFNNDHWWPVSEKPTSIGNYEKIFAEHMTAEKLKSLCSNVESNCNPLIDKDTFVSAMHRDTEFKGNPLVPSDFKAVIESNREERLAELEEKLKDLILVDNKVWKRGKPPVAYIKHYLLAGNERQDIVGLIKILPENHPEIKNPLHAYSLAQFNDASEAAMKFVEGAVDNPNASIQPIIFIEESIVNNAEKHAIVEIARKVDELFSDHHSNSYRKMNSIDSETGIAYFEFRRALVSLDGSESGLDNLAEAMARFAPLCGAVHEQCGSMLKNALERWDWRPININSI